MKKVEFKNYREGNPVTEAEIKNIETICCELSRKNLRQDAFEAAHGYARGFIDRILAAKTNDELISEQSVLAAFIASAYIAGWINGKRED